jgi:hypothetical protein
MTNLKCRMLKRHLILTHTEIRKNLNESDNFFLRFSQLTLLRLLIIVIVC